MFVITKEIELFSVYMAAGIIAYDPDIKRYVGIGKGPGILLVDLGRTKEDKHYGYGQSVRRNADDVEGTRGYVGSISKRSDGQC